MSENSNRFDFLKRFIPTLQNLSLGFYVIVSLLLVLLTYIVFPDRIASLLAMLNRMFLSTVFVQLIYVCTPSLDKESKPIVLAAALIGAGMSL